ncbi:hypothetical protein PAXRUDRAFT_146651 [Paxillus rubicundulus Ve08.2h10]|uniref:CSC1/OSCA1-like 7TM region domain-containing protein n=1 Tax=Paxillus rubicundulus Ve08.2h10 TaxID=930991 RepID=A0A0D0DUH9_9AGAM|nr:hypothetical protein PAXRUDRAFT_146651 [Paxillus rubicundulus Ve08.2h10]
MSDIQTRPFSKDYSGLLNQSVIAIGLTVICLTSYEVMKRRRRGPHPPQGTDSVESWQFGYLYQGRSWARNPSPPPPTGWPLSWVKDSLKMSQDELNDLRGVDATLYVSFLRGCLFFTLLHTFTTAPILLPIHIHFSSGTGSSKSMTRASIASLVLTPEGLELLWIHICVLFWLALTWVANLFYVCNCAFKLRTATIHAAARRAEADVATEKDAQFHPHPHPQFPFQDIPLLFPDCSNRGLRLRTVMVVNVPVQLRFEKELKEYFEYYMSRPIDKPSVGLCSSKQPGLMDKFLAFVFNRAKRIPQHLPLPQSTRGPTPHGETDQRLTEGNRTPFEEPPRVNPDDIPIIDRVIIARRMTELASLLERREDILRSLETAHIKLAKKTISAVAYEMVGRQERIQGSLTKDFPDEGQRNIDIEGATPSSETMNLLIQTLAPYVAEFDAGNRTSTHKAVSKATRTFWRHHISSRHESGHKLTALTKTSSSSPDMHTQQPKTIWDALLALPRSALDPYQPLIHLSVLFRGKTVPSIDYYTAKLNLLTSLIAQNRARAISDYSPVSTAFVTFKDPTDARRACKYLAVHPDNPLACIVTMAPQYEDIDWTRVMKSTFRAELVKDWVVNLGVWGFTIFWLFPVSLFVGLVSIQSIASFWPSLYNYLSRHPWEEEIIQSFLPTILVSLLTILIPPILLLIAKKAQTITTLSLLHDMIMTRYYKFLIVNVLVFFCVGTVALQSFLTSFKNVSGSGILQVIASSFPTAGPFYVGWLIFTTAIHGCLELVMCKRHSCLPLFMYHSTKGQITPRKRAVGIRPRTFNFYYWLPNHLLIIHICLVFAVLNPLVLPFGLIYFAVETVVIKNQLLHVYAKNYECNGHILLIRMVRYSLDGLILSQFVFLAYMAVLKKTVNLALAAVLIILTAGTKVVLTRMCRSRFERDDILEAEVICRTGSTSPSDPSEGDAMADPGRPSSPTEERRDGVDSHPSSRFLTWRIPEWINFFYNANPRAVRHPHRRQPYSFRTRQESFPRLKQVDENREEQSLPAQSRSTDVIGSPISIPSVGEHHSVLPVANPIVSKHPPHPAWDDESRYDIPYDNPFYTRPIVNTLWLPRNPCGLINLDDTVDVRESLTSEPGAGDLGHWSVPSVRTMTPIYESPARSPDEERGASNPKIMKQYSGTEEIDLPEGIRSRVIAITSEEEIERRRDRRPSLFRRRLSSSGTSAGNSILGLSRGLTGRSQTLDGLPAIQRVSSPQQDVVDAARPRGSSILPLPEWYADTRVRGEDPAVRPDSHTQADLMRSMGSFFPHGGASGISLARSANVSTGEAVFNEALAEEQIATEERLKKEEAEAGQTHRRRLPPPAWLISRIYARAARNHPR